MVDFVLEYWLVFAAGLALFIYAWRTRTLNQIIHKAFQWMERWIRDEIADISREDVDNVVGYFYDIAMSHVPSLLRLILEFLLPKKHVQDLAWELWNSIFAVQQATILSWEVK